MEPDPHTALLSCVERIKELVLILRVETHTGIFHGQEYAIVRILSCSDQQLPRTILNINHRMRGIQEKIQNDLLQLHSIAHHHWKVVRKLLFQKNLVGLEFTPR